jgi:hypothetical protein
MNPRERVLAMVIAGIVLAAGAAFVLYEALLSPLGDKTTQIERMNKEIEDAKRQRAQAIAEQQKLGRYRILSLPGDLDVAKREYGNYLSQLLLRSGFQGGTFTVTPGPADKTSPTIGPKKQPIYTRLGYRISGPAKMESLVKLLEEFYRTGVLHQIKSLTIDQPQLVGGRPSTELQININVEALVVTGADPRPYVLPNIDRRLLAADAMAALSGRPYGLGQLLWAAGPSGPNGPGVLARSRSEYAAIAKKNIFTGPPEKEPSKGEPVLVTRFVKLTDISRTNGSYEAVLWDQFSDTETRLMTKVEDVDIPVSVDGMPPDIVVLAPGKKRPTNQLRIIDNLGQTVISGQVLQVEARHVIFSANDNYYLLHVGQTIEEALRTPMSRDQVESLLKEPAAVLLENGSAPIGERVPK